MRLSELAASVPGSRVESGGDFVVRRVVSDSRRVEAHDLFVAVAGGRVDGHEFARSAAARGAAVAVERPVPLPEGVPCLRLPSTRWGLGELAAALHGHPARRMATVGVTGTDGKTTVTHMAAHLLTTLGTPAGLLSTVALSAGPAGARDNRSGLTSVEATDLQASLAEMASAGMRAAVIESTSHALVQGRVAACEFDVAAYTRIGHDHLDYHRSWDAYFRAKATLIELCAAGHRKGIPKTAVLNADDPTFPRLAAMPIERRLTYSTGGDGDITASDVTLHASGSRFRLRFRDQQAWVDLGMPAGFNVSNALCAAAICAGLSSCGAEQLAAGLCGFPGVPGRLESVRRGQPFRVYVDFAHSADGLDSVLSELRPAAGNRLLLVFGATGRADHDRPGMGRAAARGADWFVITTDDPAGEDPAQLLREVESGVQGRVAGRDYEVEPDRRAAIRRALALARPGDVVLLAGKGHERTMIHASGAEPWDERAEAEAGLRDLGW